MTSHDHETMYDAVVVGLGGVGSFAMRALAKSGGGRFLGLEQFSRGHARGSSHGMTRIYRRAYFEHPSYVPWIERSLDIFGQLEQSRKVSLMQKCGTLLMQPALRKQMPPLLKASWDSAQEHKILVEYLSPVELVERYPQFQYGGTLPDEPMVGLLEPNGGFLRPELAQEAALEEATTSDSVSIMENTKVLSFREIRGSPGSSNWIDIDIQNDDSSGRQVISARRLLVSMGPWTGQLLPVWANYLRVIRQLQGWMDVSTSGDPKLFGYEHMPTWVMETPGWHKPLYGVPCDSDESSHKHWLKMGIHGRDHVLEDPTTQNPPDASHLEREELEQASAHAYDMNLLGQSSRFVDVKPCLYTMTPDSNYLLGVPDGYSNVFAVAGLSGHGFKMTPALGQMMADFALERSLDSWDLDFCSPNRFR